MLQPHPTSQIFLPMGQEEFEEFKNDIKEHGLLNPIVMYEGKILDGNHRYRSCLELGIEPKFIDFTNTVISDLDFVVSQNLKRRHLTLGQKAAAAIEYKKRISERLLAQRASAGKNHLTPKHLLTGRVNRSDAIAGKAFGISGDSVNRALILKKRSPELFEKVSKGEMSLRGALEMSKPRTHFDREAKRVIDNSDLCEISAPPSVYASDYEIWVFDKYLKRKGFNLCLNRVGDNFEAVYSKSESSMHGFPTYKAAIIAAGKAALETENHEATHNPKKN